jgi:DNA-directed RNA polymerase subunit K/omega
VVVTSAARARQLAAEHADVPVVVVTGKPEAAIAARDRIGPENVFSAIPRPS